MKAFGLLGVLVSVAIGMFYVSKSVPTAPTTEAADSTEITTFATDTVNELNARTERQQAAVEEALRQIR